LRAIFWVFKITNKRVILWHTVKKRIGAVVIALCLIGFIKIYRWHCGASSLHAGIKTKQGLRQPFQISLPSSSRYPFLKGQLHDISFPVTVDNLSNETLIRYGTLLKVPGARATIIMCHGFMCDKKDIGIIRMLLKNSVYPCNILAFDFRAHGESCEDQFCTMGKYEIYDILGAVAFLKKSPETKKLPIIGYGFSMGAVSLIETQGKDEQASPFDALILDCPFDSSDTILKQTLARLKLSFLGYEFGLPAQHLFHKYFFNAYIQHWLKMLLRSTSRFEAQNVNLLLEEVTPGESAKKIKVPTFVITCINDEKVPLESVRTVYDNLASNYKEFWITNGRRHFDSLFYNPELYTYRVIRFIEKFIEGKLSGKNSPKISKISTDTPDDLTLKIREYRGHECRRQNSRVCTEEEILDLGENA